MAAAGDEIEHRLLHLALDRGLVGLVLEVVHRDHDAVAVAVEHPRVDV